MTHSSRDHGARTPERVCVAGATGYLGARVVATLRARAIPVVAILKDRSRETDIHRITALGAEIAIVDASRLESYTEALSQATIAISCMASRESNVDATSDFWAIDRDANIRFGLEAVRAGVKHVILVATFEGRDSRHVSEFSEAKEFAVDAIGEGCREGGTAFTVVRPTAYFSDLTDRVFDSVLTQARYTVLGDGSDRINPVHGDDVAAFLADCAADPNRVGGEHRVGGPEIFTFREIGMLAAVVLGKQDTVRIRTIPIGLLRVVATIADAAGHVSRKIRRSAALLHWMIFSSTHDAIAPCCGTRRLLDEYLAKREAQYPCGKHPLHA
jgi:uncharacterized protein YbjT (DUF2867 family)